MTATFELLMAFKNKNLPKGINSPFVLDEKTRIANLKQEHLGLLAKKKYTQSDSIFADSKCIVRKIETNKKVSSWDEILTDNDVAKIVQSIIFSLNINTEPNGFSVSDAYLLRKMRKYTLQHKYESATASFGGISNRPELKPGATPAKISQVINDSSAAMSKDKTLLATIRRYNSACSNRSLDDKIVDISICLESIASAEQEISFQFSLFNSLCSTPEPNKRKDIYDKLKKLYTWRSKIVHGNDSRINYEDVNKVLPDAFRVAAYCILYKVQFVNSSAGGWKDHLVELSLGAAEPLWEKEVK